MTALIVISIGPVQDFIAAARRSCDLWYGSYLLSEVSKAAARALQEAGATLLFPYPNDPTGDLAEGSDFTVANKVLVLSDKPPEQLCRQAKAAARSQLKKAHDAAIREVENKNLRVDTSLAASQVESFLEFSAVWVPYQENEHQNARRRVEELLAARKALRDFEQYKLGSARPKSSLDGFRETVLQPNGRPRRLFESHLKLNEHLDGIGLTKRFGKTFGKRIMPEFDSTVDVAAKPYIHRIQNSHEFGQYWAFVDNYLGYKTAALLYEHDSRQLFDQEEKDLSGEDRAALKELTSIRNKIYELHGRPNAPYYALMVGDGDFMGRAISQLLDIRVNQEFSRALSRFANRAKLIIEEHEGCPIYTGGDDVMALLPLHTVLNCTEGLRREFAEIGGKYDVSFSAGLAIAHALEPLSEVLRLARNAESRAKRLPEKDAVAFTVCPRSGANVEITGKWDLILLLREIAEAYLATTPAAKRLSLGFAHELREMHDRIPVQLDPILKELALTAAGKKQGNEKAVDLVERYVIDHDRASLYHLSQAMLAARPIYRALKESKELLG